jgi:carboxylate-amine ligase
MVAAARSQPQPQPLDEARAPDGAPRAHYATLLDALAARDLGELGRAVARGAEELGMMHGAHDAAHPYALDPVPRLFTAAEWRMLEAGLAQRVRALEAFVADVHGPQAALRDGVVPRAAVETCVWFEAPVLELPAPPVWIAVAGPDVVRDGEGRLVVLEDNVRTPTMMGYAVAARRVLDRALGADAPPAAPIEDLLVELLRRVLGGAGARVAILSDGAANAVQWEVEHLGRLLGAPVLEPRELRDRDGRLTRRDTGEAVDVLFRRTSEERLLADDGRPNELGELLLGPLRAGTLRVANAFGTGVADDKRVYPHVEDLVRYFTGEAPLVRSVPTYDLADPAQRAEAMERLDELVVKPRGGSGGYGVVVGPKATDEQLAEARAAVRERPEAFVAQAPVAISTHPTLVDGELVPRHLDLRPFVFSDGETWQALPGGLSRYALGEGDVVVNSSQGGGGKDVRVLPDAA